MSENEQKPELEPTPWKKRAPEPEPEPHSWKPRVPELEPRSWNEELLIRNCAIFTTAPQL